MVLPLKGYDAILGIQWLLSLGSITWDFTAMSMQFVNKGKSCRIQGILLGNVELMSKKEVTRCFFLFDSESTPCALVLASEQQVSVTTPTPQKQQADLQPLLEEF